MNKIVVVFSVSVIIFIATGIKFINSLDTHSRTSTTEFLPDYKLESESVDPELIQTIKKKAIKSRVIALGFVKQNSCSSCIPNLAQASACAENYYGKKGLLEI